MADEKSSGVDAHLMAQRVQDLRGALHEHLKQHQVYSQLRSIIAAHAADHADFNPSSPEEVLSVITERGIVQEILGKLDVRGAVKPSRAIPSGGGRFVHIRLLGGRAFLNFLDEETSKSRKLFVAAHMNQQHFVSQPQPCMCDPPFEDDFVVRLADGDLLSMNQPLTIAVVREDLDKGTRRVIGENTLDWRRALLTGFLSITVELSGDNPGVPAGVLEFQLELVPATRRHSDEEIAMQVQQEKNHITSADREFLVYARRWWDEYHSMRPTHAQRKVKVFAPQSGGRMLPVVHFVHPMRADRMLDSPQAAARFVSLFVTESGDDATNDMMTPAAESWCSHFKLFLQRRGNNPTHATLLCSLLLGFGLDAYCAIGTDRGHAVAVWVVTRKKIGPTKYESTYWNPTSGERSAQNGNHPFLTIGCVFNHFAFYANASDIDNAALCSFDLDNETEWKPLNQIKLRLVPRLTPPPIPASTIVAANFEADVEAALKTCVFRHREALGHPTKWDSQLAYVSTQSLVAYEHQRVYGEPLDTTYFQTAVKNVIAEGKTFKAFPINFSHGSARRMLAAILGNQAGRDILDTSADDAHHALRVKVALYPADVVSVWVMLGVRYRSLPH